MNLALENRLLLGRSPVYSRPQSPRATNQINFITFVFCFPPQQRQSLLLGELSCPPPPTPCRPARPACFSSCSQLAAAPSLILFFSLSLFLSLRASQYFIPAKLLFFFSTQNVFLPFLARGVCWITITRFHVSSSKRRREIFSLDNNYIKEVLSQILKQYFCMKLKYVVDNGV